MVARSAHMAGLKIEKTNGAMRDGGAILNDKNEMIGSVVLCEFEDRAALDRYLSSEVYVRNGLWDNIEILDMRFIDWQKLITSP